ncbi:MAG TPA: DUF3459 domain-containing protein, partial [Kribbella sp.]|nr:DUF3459 domain-containing protein [Kribbella sp.]
RRPAPMLDGDVRRIAMAHAIVQSLPGAPVVRYGDEIGMGDDLSLPDRMSVRTPMQWSAELNGGFSKAPPGVVGPGPIQEGPFAFSRVNVEGQELRSDSLLSRVSQLVRIRRELGELPSHRCGAVALDRAAVFGVLHHRADDSVLMLANLSADEVRLRLPYDVRADLLADSEYEPARKDSVLLAGHGYRWLRVHDDTR